MLDRVLSKPLQEIAGGNVGGAGSTTFTPSLLGELKGLAEKAIGLVGVALVEGYHFVESFMKSRFLHRLAGLHLRHRRLCLSRFPPVLETKPCQKGREDKGDQSAFLAR